MQLIGNLVSGKTHLITANLSDTLQTGLERLHTNNILSLPVLNDESKIAGIVSVLDIASFIGSQLDASCSKRDILKIPLSSVVACHLEGRALHVFKPTEKIEDLFPYFGSGVHRVLVEHAEGYSNLSQTDVLEYLWKHPEPCCVHLQNKTLEELGLHKKRVISVDATIPAITAIQKLSETNVSALAIIDEDGKLVANLSASDLRGLSSQHVDRLALNVLEFLEKPCQEGATHLKEPISVCPKTKFGDCISKMVQEHVHRVWVMEEQKPVGIVSMSDVFTVIGANLGRRKN